MKWLHNFFSRKRRERLCRVRDFVVLAWTGNGLGAAELAFLRQLMARYRFEADLLNVVSQAPDKVADAYPAAAEERALHLVRMVRFALRHGKENDRARAYCRLTARKMGLPQGSSQAAAARLRARPDADDRSVARRLLRNPSPPDGGGGSNHRKTSRYHENNKGRHVKTTSCVPAFVSGSLWPRLRNCFELIQE